MCGPFVSPKLLKIMHWYVEVKYMLCKSTISCGYNVRKWLFFFAVHNLLTLVACWQ